MLKRTKKALVESFVGAIALGWLLAQGVLHFANIFSAPIEALVLRREFSSSLWTPKGSPLQYALPEVAKALSLLLIGYVLLGWLYFKPVAEKRIEPDAESKP